MREIAVHGGGYVGLVVASVFAGLGHVVYLIEPDGERLRTLVSGESPISEPGLGASIADGVLSGRLRPIADSVAAADCSVHFVAVGTPPGINGAADESQDRSSCYRRFGYRRQEHGADRCFGTDAGRDPTKPPRARIESQRADRRQS